MDSEIRSTYTLLVSDKTKEIHLVWLQGGAMVGLESGSFIHLRVRIYGNYNLITSIYYLKQEVKLTAVTDT